MTYREENTPLVDCFIITSHILYYYKPKAGMNTLLVLLCMSSVALGDEFANNVTNLPSINEYFPELNGDYTKIRWAHAVNSRLLLKKALGDDNVMMLEADIVLGTLIGQNEVIPIMAHPPLKTSDLSLQMFIEGVISAQKDKRKGIKLDFKSTESFQSSWKVIDSLKNKIDFPVFLNADIVFGPVNSTTKPVDANVFLKLSSTKLPSSTLSIGWTTKFGPGMEGTYTEEQLKNMQTALESNKIMQPVTFCFRAGIVAKSVGIKNFVDKINAYQKSNTTSVTIWMSTDSDPVDVPRLRSLILALNKTNVFLDVPKFISDQLDLNMNSAGTPINAAQGTLAALLTSVPAFLTNMF